MSLLPLDRLRGICYNQNEVRMVVKLFNEWFLGDTKFDLRPVAFGDRACVPEYRRSMELCTHYMMHYIVSGKGVLKKNNITYHLGAGQVFISRPQEVISFQADVEEPWRFIWIKFTGAFAKKLETLPNVVEVDGTPFLNMANCDKESSTVEEYITAQLYLVFAHLFEDEKRHDYVTMIKNYIRSRPTMDKISVEEIQQFVNLNRQYMSTMFKKKTGLSVQEYIIRERMERATLLLQKDFSIAEIAEFCGYSSIYAFSKCFKKTFGISPSAYKKESNRLQ
jgi:AraC family transcriptional regulator of arabinose operon